MAPDLKNEQLRPFRIESGWLVGQLEGGRRIGEGEGELEGGWRVGGGWRGGGAIFTDCRRFPSIRSRYSNCELRILIALGQDFLAFFFARVEEEKVFIAKISECRIFG